MIKIPFEIINCLIGQDFHLEQASFAIGQSIGQPPWETAISRGARSSGSLHISENTLGTPYFISKYATTKKRNEPEAPRWTSAAADLSDYLCRK